MSWKDKMKDFGGSDISFLSEDGETIVFVVVGEPVLLKGKYKGKPSEKIGCPIMTEDGFSLFIAGKRLARKISKHEEDFEVSAFIAQRYGEQNDINSYYGLKVLCDEPRTNKLFALTNGVDFTNEIAEAVDAANSVVQT